MALRTNIYQEDIIDDLISVITNKPLSAAQGKILYDLVTAAATVPTGTILPYTGLAAPTGYFFTDGSALNRTTYSGLFSILSSDKGTFTVTIASPGVFTLNSHGLATGDCVSLSTTGALPTGLAVATNYYVVYVSANTFNLATTYANAIATVPTKINTSGSQSGTHSLLYAQYGISGASDFLLPDSKAAFLRGTGTSTKYTQNKTIGSGHYNDDTFQGHRQNIIPNGTVVGIVAPSGGGSQALLGTSIASYAGTSTGDPVTDTVNGTPRTGNETAGKSLGVNFIIKW